MAGKNSGRPGPSDPAAIAARRAAERLEARQAERDPSRWGVNVEALALPTAANTNIAIGNDRSRIVSARRSDGFDLLYAGKGLSQQQHLAARRLFRDYCTRGGVRDAVRPGLDAGKVDNAGRWDLSDRISQAQLDAGQRIQFVLRGVGPVNARILNGQIAPVVDEGREVLVWRAALQAATGEANKDAQGALLRQACESARLMYDLWDVMHRRAAA